MERSKPYQAAVWSLLLIAFALRVWTLGDKAVWWDEAWSIWAAQQPFAQTTEITARDVHPPLYQWALHGWVRAAGISEFSARYLSVIWSLLTAAVVYALARRLGGQRAGLLALLFTAFSAFFIHWAQETRMYAQAAFLCGLASYAYLWVTTPPPSPLPAGREGESGDNSLKNPPPSASLGVVWWVVLVLSGAGVALTHYLGAFVLVILNVHWLVTFRARSRGFHIRWMVAMAVTGAILLTWVIYALPLTRSGDIDNDFSAALIFQLAATLLAAGTSVNLDQYTAVSVIVVVVFFIGLALRNFQKTLLVWLMALLPPLAIYGLSLLESSFYSPKPEERYLIIFAPVVFAGVGLALDSLMRWRIGSIAVFVLLALYGQAYLRDVDTRYMRDDYAMMLRTVDVLAQSDEPVLFVSDDRYPLVFYHLNRRYSELHALGITAPEGRVHDENMQKLIGGAERFWVVQIERHFRDPDGLTIQWLDARYQKVLDIPVDYNRLTLYAAQDTTPPDSEEVLPPVIEEARPGDTVRIGAAGKIEMLYGDNVVFSTDSEAWRLEQFPIYPAYPSGDYGLRAGENDYPFRVTRTNLTLPHPTTQPVAVFDSMALSGYEVNDTNVRPGETFEITLFWEVLERPSENYTVFAHLLGPFTENGPVWAGDDSYPAGTPTTALWEGLRFNETRRLTVPEHMPAGTYEVEIGLYVLETGERVQLANGEDRVVLPGFVVEP